MRAFAGVLSRLRDSAYQLAIMAKKKTERDAERDLAATVQEIGKALAYAHRALATQVKDFREAAAWGDLTWDVPKAAGLGVCRP